VNQPQRSTGLQPPTPAPVAKPQHDALHNEVGQCDRLTVEIAALRRQIESLNGHLFVRAQNSVPGLFGYNFLRGLALGLGTVVGATILVSVAAYFLSRIDFLPIIGTWAGEIAKEIQAKP